MFSDYPISYWFTIGVILAGMIWSFRRIKDGTGLPLLAVIGTVTVWYVGDAYYNDYAHSYMLLFQPDILEHAWWEVGWFLIVLMVAVPCVHRWYNRRHLQYQSGVLQLAKFGINQPFLQRQLDILFQVSVLTYGIIVIIAAIRIKGQMLYFFCPYLGHVPAVWGRGRIGVGFDAALTVIGYVQMTVSGIFGVLAAVSTNPRIRVFALVLCFLSWPFYVFDRTRNAILAVVIPGIISWVFLRLRGGILKKGLVLAAFFIVVNAWLGFIIQNRSSESITAAFQQHGFSLEKESDVHHEGLNMFEELCWINTFIKKGTYKVNWGARYFAELVNPIPRVVWHNKPLIGIDYAIARGQGTGGSRRAGGAGVYATVSTGMIGEGVVNFGTILGPAAAALLMSFWVAILARQDLHIFELGRLPLYALGLILTFNLGRDITFITLYPFVFFAGGLWLYERHFRPSSPGAAMSGPANHPAFQGLGPASNPLASRPPGKTGGMLVRRRKIVRRGTPRQNIVRRPRRPA